MTSLRETASGWRDRWITSTAPRAVPLTVAGAVITAVGAFLPWATFDFGYPGGVASAGVGGHRLYLVLLALAALVVLRPVPGRRGTAFAAALGALVITVFVIVTMTNDGGGLGAVAVGAWVGLVGSLVYTAGSVAVEEIEPRMWPPLRGFGGPIYVVAVVGVFLFAVVRGLAIDDSNQFIAFGIFIIAATVSLTRLGALGAYAEAFRRYRYVGLAAIAAAAIVFPFTQDGEAVWLRVAANASVFAAAAIGLNVVVGLAGLLDLGYVAFFGIGGYFAALFANSGYTTVHIHIAWLLVVILGALVAATFGVIIGAPTLRLRGDYLAIVTLGFGEIFRIVANNWDGLTRGPNGISSIPDLELGPLNLGRPHVVFGVTLPFQANYYYLGILLVAVVMLIFSRLNDSRIGRAWVAIREDELAARAMGINTVALKLLAFAIGAFLAGGSGTLNAHIGGQVDPSSYTFLASALLLAAVVLGGMGTVTGAVLGATLLYLIPEKLRFVQDYRLLLFGVALVLLMRFRPEGIIASRRRQREFRDPTSGADAMSGPADMVAS